MDFNNLKEEDVQMYLGKLRPENAGGDVDYDTFARLIAVILEDKS